MKRVNITLDFRFVRYNGQVWTKSSFDYKFWQRYLMTFEHVNIIARVEDTDSQEGLKPVTGEGVSFTEIPYFLGPKDYFFKRGAIRKKLKEIISPNEAYIMRVPSTIADILQPLLMKNNIEYGIELVGNPYDTFKKGSYKHPLRLFFQYWLTKNVKTQIFHAKSSSYVTKTFLQELYPNQNRDKQFSYSSISLLPEHIVAEKESFNKNKKLLFVGSLEYLVKSPDTLIKAFYKALQRNKNISLTIVGDGKERDGLESLVKSLGLSDKVTFLGFLNGGEEVRAVLDEHDIYILTSISEGLPRSMVEAMARGLPCIGSTIGGIKELLDSDDLVDPQSVEELSEKILEFCSNDKMLKEKSKRNIEVAKTYQNEILDQQRKSFYQSLT
ncbi:glycosyltransferase family 4 protein [Halobacteriovorax sp. BALOs_7]|uniref:glycosyltransferase family 4 protein n=1 Tax=unclassified Halobacteriovorax TaxID=2639665 RepID=UPI0013C4E990|nr:glycosyltransferase [Halobacteriovorax sp. BALOs_7]